MKFPAEVPTSAKTGRMWGTSVFPPCRSKTGRDKGGAPPQAFPHLPKPGRCGAPASLRVTNSGNFHLPKSRERLPNVKRLLSNLGDAFQRKLPIVAKT